ncbi:unnamed protein product, partial [Ilex paraguariensis]
PSPPRNPIRPFVTEAELIPILDGHPVIAPTVNQFRAIDTLGDEASEGVATISPKAESPPELSEWQKHTVKKRKAVEISESNQGEEVISPFCPVLKAKGRRITMKNFVVVDVNVVVGKAKGVILPLDLVVMP